MEGGQRTARCHFKNRTATWLINAVRTGTAILSCPVETSIDGLHQTRRGIRTVWAALQTGGTKTVECSQSAAGGHLKNCPATRFLHAGFAGPAVAGRAVEVSIICLHERSGRIRAVGAIAHGAEVIECG